MSGDGGGRVQSVMGGRGGCAELGHSISPSTRDACRKEGRKEGEARVVVSNLMYGLNARERSCFLHRRL